MTQPTKIQHVHLFTACSSFYHLNRLKNVRLTWRNFPSGPVTPSAGGLHLIPGQETRSHMLQLRPSTGK